MAIQSYLLGIKGENTAAEYLNRQDFRIIERNFHSHHGEIDIIANDKDSLVFVEVKAYSSKSFIPPIYAISKSKKNSIIHAAKSYLHKNKIKDIFCRFDVVVIYKNISGIEIIEHIKNAFTI